MDLSVSYDAKREKVVIQQCTTEQANRKTH